MIYLCSQEDLPWLEYTEETLLSRTVLAPDIKTIEELVITEGGKTHRFRFEHVGEETEQITCDGTKTDGDSFRNFYYTLAGMSADEVLFDGFPDTSSMKEFLGIRYRYQDGTEDVLVCYEEGSRQIYGELNQKERGFRLSASQVETMLETLKRLTEGEEITPDIRISGRMDLPMNCLGQETLTGAPPRRSLSILSENLVQSDVLPPWHNRQGERKE